MPRRYYMSAKRPPSPPPSTLLSAEDEQRVRALLRVLREFEDMPAPVASMFLLVALNEGASLTELVELSGRPQSTASRNLLDLGDHTRNGTPGYQLVEWRFAPGQLRRKEYRLTQKGRGLLRRILEELETAAPETKNAAEAS